MDRTVESTSILIDLTKTSSAEKARGTMNEHSKPDSNQEIVDYWTELLQDNLSRAHTSYTSDSVNSEINEEILDAPRRKSAQSALASDIATRLYPDLVPPLASIIQYEKDIVMLRSMILDQRRNSINVATEHNLRHTWIHKISEQGPWDEIDDPLPLTGAPSLPMPVEQADPASLAQFFAHLACHGTPGSGSNEGIAGVEPFYNTELLEFEKGVLYADGRVDLCKMVTGPRNIGDLMQALRTNTFSKHFLLGNNIIGPAGAKAIASFIDEYPDRFETWYLAGNCIDGASFKILVNSMTKSNSITNVWLKRNPLGSDAAHDIFRLITETPNLRTLDLDQTELGDGGVARLFELLIAYAATRPLAFRHIYLNACGISKTACKQIAQYLQSPNCTLESLYISNNPIGNAASILAAGVKMNNTLKRLVLESCGLKDEGIIALAKAIKDHVSITVFDIGQSYATGDLGTRYNWITDNSTEALADMVENSNLEYLDISYTPASQASLVKLLEAVCVSDSLVWFHVKPLVVGGKDTVSVKAGQIYARLHKLVRERLHENVKEKYDMDYVRFENEKKRFLISPTDVRFIDSVYRNRDAAAARRGLKKLEKWWDYGDETLERVRDGTLGEETS